LNLHEYQAKEILARYGVPVPPGRVAYTPGEARGSPRSSASGWSSRPRCMRGGEVKQRREAGRYPQEAYGKAQAILGMNIKGLTVRKILVAEAVDGSTTPASSWTARKSGWSSCFRASL